MDGLLEASMDGVPDSVSKKTTKEGLLKIDNIDYKKKAQGPNSQSVFCLTTGYGILFFLLLCRLARCP